MTMFRPAALAATCLLALAAPDAGAILPTDRLVRMHTATLTTQNLDGVGVDWAGQCHLAAVTDPTLQFSSNRDVFTGVLAGAVVAYRPGNPASPVNGTLTCQVKVNGVTKATTAGSPVPASTTTVLTAAREAQYLAHDPDIVTLCAVVTAGTTSTQCVQVDETTVPSHEVADLLNAVLRELDPVICPVLGALAPASVFSLLVFSPQGDVSVNGVQWYDCPPYGV